MASLNDTEARARQYARIKYSLAIFDILYALILVLAFLSLGLPKVVVSRLSLVSSSTYFLIPAFLFILSLGYHILNFPLEFYQAFILEHKFSLTKQRFGGWAIDQLKGGMLFYIFSLILISVFYFTLRGMPRHWWLAVAAFWVFFSVFIARIMPVFIVPLFFKYRKLEDENLRQRVMGLADKMKVKILDVFEIDFSKKTLKANAAFVGLGDTRRVILADTLKDKYTLAEIEVILAHEFAHYKLKHLIRLVLVNSSATGVLFYIIFKTNAYALSLFGFTSLSDIAALPLVFLYLMLFGLISQPFENFISRAFERDADLLALKVTADKEAFISAMNKLAGQNLADRSPHPLIKFFFFDHPPIDERIKLANRNGVRPRNGETGSDPVSISGSQRRGGRRGLMRRVHRGNALQRLDRI